MTTPEVVLWLIVGSVFLLSISIILLGVAVFGGLTNAIIDDTLNPLLITRQFARIVHEF